MGYMRRLFESRPFTKLVPDVSLIAGDPGTGAGRAMAAHASDGSFAFVYLPEGRPLGVRLSAIAGRQVRAWWFDPRTGTARRIGVFAKKGTRTFAPATAGRGNDWVLVLDDSGRRFVAPGTPARPGRMTI
jgi:hypothetical protein